MRFRLNDLQQKEIAELYGQGITRKQIAQRFEVGEMEIYEALKRENVVMRVSHRKWRFDSESGATIAREYESGMTIEELALKYSASNDTIRRTLIRENAQIRPLGTSKFKHIIHDNIFDVIDTEEKAYWLGFIASDGNVSSSKKMLCIGLATKDIGHLEKFCQWISVDLKPYTYTYKTQRSMVHVYSAQIVKSLAQYGIIPRKTYIFKHIPDIPHNLKRHFIRGYVDGDGCLHINKLNKPRFSVVSYNKEILDEIQEHIIQEIGVTKVPIRKVINIWNYTKGGMFQVPRIVEYLYKDANIYLDRKYDTAMIMLAL